MKLIKLRISRSFITFLAGFCAVSAGSALAQQELADANTAFAVTKLMPNSRTWQRVVSQTNGDDVTLSTNSFEELRSGLAFLNPETGNWEESDENFQIVKGHAVARRSQHSVIISPNLNNRDGVVVDLRTPDGQRLRSGI